MTNKEAHSWLEDKQRLMTQNRWAFSSNDIDANSMAILALEKQIAKKPKNIGGELFCPICERHLCHSWDLAYRDTDDLDDIRYCKCGQALDWKL